MKHSWELDMVLTEDHVRQFFSSSKKEKEKSNARSVVALQEHTLKPHRQPTMLSSIDFFFLSLHK